MWFRNGQFYGPRKRWRLTPPRPMKTARHARVFWSRSMSDKMAPNVVALVVVIWSAMTAVLNAKAANDSTPSLVKQNLPLALTIDKTSGLAVVFSKLLIHPLLQIS